MKPIIYTILEDLKPQMKSERYDHTIGVVYTAANLAYAYGYSDEKATLAAVLHDCAKLTAIKDYVSECQKYGISVSESGRKAPHLLHAVLGAYFATQKYKIEDEEIIHAILVHSTGCPNMNTLDKILYLADFMEPGRQSFTGMDEIRHLAYQDLDKAVLAKADGVLSYAESKGYYIDPRTIETRDYYKQTIESRR
ncbi:MAG: bis(5'-nucleosyl)-tetraphosphatase (symmetrical) YqeK [Lachnospiraceae bacterium]